MDKINPTQRTSEQTSPAEPNDNSDATLGQSLRVKELPLTTKHSEKFLDDQQIEDYQKHRERFLTWLFTEGKDRKSVEGYAFKTAENFAYRTDQFYRWVWQYEDNYTTAITINHADEWADEIAHTDKTSSHKSNCLKSVRSLYRWRALRYNEPEWNPEYWFTSSYNNPRDYLTLEERRLIEEASLEYDNLPGYNDLSIAQRDRWRKYLAEVLSKPVTEVSPSDWKKVNGYKIPSLVAVSLDAGLRPIEVKRSKTSWIDLDNNALRIPREDSAKNDDNWIVALREQTVEYLEKWLRQREIHEKYRDLDDIWLTREKNGYHTQTLSYILERLCDIAGIDTENRKMSWYTLRHSTGTYMTREEGLKATSAQLRHNSILSTMIYDQAPLEFRQDALERMG